MVRASSLQCSQKPAIVPILGHKNSIQASRDIQNRQTPHAPNLTPRPDMF
jgi:hypothetical protein